MPQNLCDGGGAVMNIIEKEVETNILDFKAWLIVNRILVNDLLRRQSAIAYFLITVSVGLTIMVINTVISTGSWLSFEAIYLFVPTLLVTNSRKLSEDLSKLHQLRELSPIKSEINSGWMSNLKTVIGERSVLLQNPYIVSAVVNSIDRKLKLSILIRALIIISDSVENEHDI